MQIGTFLITYMGSLASLCVLTNIQPTIQVAYISNCMKMHISMI